MQTITLCRTFPCLYSFYFFSFARLWEPSWRVILGRTQHLLPVAIAKRESEEFGIGNIQLSLQCSAYFRGQITGFITVLRLISPVPSNVFVTQFSSGTQKTLVKPGGRHRVNACKPSSKKCARSLVQIQPPCWPRTHFQYPAWRKAEAYGLLYCPSDT